jgi:hypothetical protein
MAEGKTGLQAWAKPKEQHRKMMNMLLQSKSHIIFCARAKDNLEQVKVNGKTEIVNHGLMPIQEKNFPFEMLITLKMQDKGKVVIEKCIKGLEESLKINGYINENHGKIIADWINKGEKVNLEIKQLMADARLEAMKGEANLKNWFETLDEKQKLIAKDFSNEFKKELSKIAKEIVEDVETIEVEQGIEIENLCKQKGIEIATICKVYKIGTIIHLPVSKFAQVIETLNSKPDAVKEGVVNVN